MAEESCTIPDCHNDKSDEILFGLLGELLQNNTRATELYTLLSSQANNKSQFQNDNEYRCKEDAMEEDHDESDLNKLVDILKNRLQNGKSVPAGLTQEKLTRLKDDFLKQKEENKRSEQNNHNNIPMKKTKNAPSVPVAKPKPKNKKQLQAEQRRRELEMANIAKELEEKKKKKEEKEQVRKQHEEERKRLLEEDLRKQEEDKKRLMNENKKRKEKEEKEKEYRTQKEKERQEKLRKSQEEEQRKKEEEKRRKAEEKTAKQKALKESKEREEREKLEKQLNQKNNPSNNNKVRSQQYQQYQQQQQKYPREVPPRFLRQQQSKQQMTSQKDTDYSTINDQFRDNSNWTEIVPDVENDCNNNGEEDWGEGCVNGTMACNNEQGRTYNNSWGGIPVTEEWDSEVNQSNNHSPESRTYEHSLSTDLKGTKNVSTAPHGSSAHVSNDNQAATASDSCWGASLTGSTWDSASQTAKQWDNASAHTKNSLEGGRGSPNTSIPKPSTKLSSKPISIPLDSSKTDCPGITPWAGLDSFEAMNENEAIPMNDNHVESSVSNVYSGGAKPKTNTTSASGTVATSNHTDNARTRLKNENNEHTDSNINVSSIDNKIDTNLKVTGWLERSTPPEEWEIDEKEINHEEFGWTTVSLKTKKPVTGTTASVPGTPSSKSSDNGNAWTNRALKQLLDMGFKREHAEKALRDNNGIIESAVSDLLMKGDSNMTEPGMKPSQQTVNSKCEGNSVSSATGNSVVTPPQKLNRKQRRKLQQMQNAGQSPENAETLNKKLPNMNTVSKHDLIMDMGLKQKGDGLLPTPPPSLRLIPCEETSTPHEKTIARPQSSCKLANSDSNNTIHKSSTSLPQPIGQPPKVSTDNNSVTRAPIGTSRPSVPTPIQPPIQPPKPASNICDNSNKETVEQINNSTPLQPPTNPVLLAQMHLQKLGLETPSPVVSSTYSPSPPCPPQSTTVSSQVVTNSMIQQYLQQIAQTSEVEGTAAVSASISTSLHTSSPMHLSGLLQQAPVPASSLSEGHQKSKLLQWTQPSSASNSEPTTPPIIDDFPEERQREKVSPVNTVDPVSAKWGVVAIPRLMATHTEFKPGVPWKSHADSNDEKVAEEEGKSDDDSDDSQSDASSIPDEPPKVTSSQNVPRTSPEFHTVKEVKTFTQPPPPPILPPQLIPQQPHHPPPPPQPAPRQALPSSITLKQTEQSTVRPPPGLGSVNSFSSSVNSFSGMKHKIDEMNWLTIRGLSSAIDPSALRSQCQQFGTLIDFRILGNTAYVRYETHAHARSAHLALNGKLFYNSQILADVSTEYECMKAIENSSNVINNVPVATVPMTNHLSQSINPGFPNMSSFGGLWASPAPAAPPSLPQPFVQPSFTPNYAAPSSINMNGGFAHWGMSNATPVLPDTSHLWQATPQQPTNVFQAYPGWLTAKPNEVPVHASIFSPAMDRCLPSELLNVKEHGS